MATPAHADREALLAHQRTLDCVHCGLCTQHCPTYRLTGIETQNPRGRVYLMRALLEGAVAPTEDLVEDLDSCLVCRACETACPSGVRFGELMSHARAGIRAPGKWRRRLLRDVIPNPRRLARLAGLVRFWQRSGLRRLRFLLPGRLRALDRAAPEIPPKSERRPLPARTAACGDALGRVALFEGCVAAVLFQDVNRDTIALLSRAGFEVVVPEPRTCCGALHEHDGDAETARALFDANARAFSDPSIEAVVMNSAGCGAALRDGGARAADDPARAFGRKVVDWSRFLADRGGRLAFTDAGGEIATYDAPCHLHHAQGETTAPLELLRRVPGLRLIPMDLADQCCGAAGLYAADRPEAARAILEPKLDALARTGASTLLTGNPGCLLQWRQGVAARGLRVRVEHPASWLARRLAPA